MFVPDKILQLMKFNTTQNAFSLESSISARAFLARQIFQEIFFAIQFGRLRHSAFKECKQILPLPGLLGHLLIYLPVEREFVISSYC